MKSSRAKKDNFYEFDDKKREIVFKRHDMPSPWMKYLTNGERLDITVVMG